jgi:hypothetical protein
VAGRQRLQHGDGACGSRLRVPPVPVPPVQTRQPAEPLTEPLAVAGGLPEGYGGLASRHRLAGESREVRLDGVAFQQLGTIPLRDPVDMFQHRPVVPHRLPMGRDRPGLPGGLGPVPQHRLDVAGLAGVVHQAGDVDAIDGGGQCGQDAPV